jgi:hypothetical protein
MTALRFGVERGCLSAAVVVALAATPASAGVDVWGLVPDDTRVVVLVDGEKTASQPQARDALGTESVLARLASRRLPPAERKRQVMVFVQEGAAAHPVVFTLGSQTLANQFTKLCGAKLETAGGKPIHTSGPKGWVAALLDAESVLEGPRQTVRAVLESQDGSLAELPASQPARRLLAVTPAASTSVTLLYFAPQGGRKMYDVLQDLDRVLGAEMSASLASYESALNMLGPTQGGRLDLAQQGSELGTTLRLAMPNSMAANLTSVSLQAGKEMARAASDAAVKAGDLTQEEAAVLTEALGTMQSRADGDQVLVRVRVPEAATQQGRR